MAKDLPPGPKWFTIRDAATYLQIGEPTIYRWMRDGKITFRKIGDSTRFLQEDLDAVVTVHSSNAGTANKRSLKCASCGSEKIVHGKCQSTGNVYFVPEKSKFWTMKPSTVPLQSIMCSDCGFIAMRGDIDHLKELTEKDKIDEGA
ncbi:MAG: helix-turn-helix domain-containing protein [Lentisphaeraceae bacterium]|nr:helix-turn-helix domain-containing protein [Lentisphaeraceae bacterium]